MRELSPQVASESIKTENRPVELYRVYLDQETRYFAVHISPISFYDEDNNPVVYEPLYIKRTPVRTNIESKVDEVSCTLDNVNQEMSAIVNHTELTGRRLVIVKIFLVDGYTLLPEDCTVIFDGQMDAPSFTEKGMEVSVKSQLDFLGVEIPRRSYQPKCNNKFGDEECTADLGTVTGTIEAISQDGLTLTLSGRTEAEGWFEDGILFVGTEYEMVVSSNGTSITIAYPFKSAQTGDSYTMRRGCNKIFEACDKRFNNAANFGGFRSISLERFITV